MEIVAKPVIIFNFDRTLIDADSDTWVIANMDLFVIYSQWLGHIPWISLMDMLLGVLHSNGKTAKDIADCLERIPMDTKIKEAIRSAHFLGCVLKIVSNSNTFFIETVLKKHGIYDCFSSIISNKTELTTEGRIKIIPYHIFTKTKSCSACPPLVCKDFVFKDMQLYYYVREKYFNDKKVRYIYIGDGSDDYCLTVKLRKEDFVMPRKDYPLWRKILEEPNLVNASINEWKDGEELEQSLFNLINIIRTSTNFH